MKPQNIDLSREYEVSVDFVNLLKDLAKNNPKSYAIVKEFLPSDVDFFIQTGKLTFRLFDMNGAKKISEVESRYKEAGYLPSSILELLSSTNTYPELEKFFIVAFGSGRYFNNGQDFYRPTVSKNDEGQVIGYGCFGYSENLPCCLIKKTEEFYFLGTKIDAR